MSNVEDFNKAPSMPPGTVITQLDAAQRGYQGQMTRQSRQGNGSRAQVTTGAGGGDSKFNELVAHVPPTMISDVDLANNWFTPMQPVAPFGPPSQTYPRGWDYPVGVNIDFQPAQLLLFGMLRSMAQSWGLLRAVIETRKDDLMRIPYQIRLKDKPDATNKRLEQLREFFKRPDRKMNYDQWLRAILDDRFVIDAASVYSWRSADGATPYAFSVLDGAMIKPLIDDAGRRPDFPNPAYQQIVKGLPMINLDETELLYAPARTRSYIPVFGYSEVEQIQLGIMQGIAKDLYNSNFWKDGTLPDMIMTVPDTWNPQQIAAFQAMFDAMMSGNLKFKSKIRFMPGGMTPFDIKNSSGEALKTDQDEWLARLVCYTFSTSPAPFIKQMNRATAESSANEAEQEGLHPLMKWVTDAIMNPLIQGPIGFGYDDCEFVYVPERQIDPKVEMETGTGYVKSGVKTPNEHRKTLGLPPQDGGDELIIVTAAGPVPLKETVEAARQQALAKPDELDRQAEAHDKTMSAPVAGPGKKEVGKAGRLPFGVGTIIEKRGKRYIRLKPNLPTRPAAQQARKTASKKVGSVLRFLGISVARQLRSMDKIAKAKGGKSADEIVGRIDLDDLKDVIGAIQPELEDIAQDAAYEALSSVGLEGNESIVNVVNERAVELARNNAAELVGMRYNKDGDLVEAARAEFRIDETTREMIRDAIAQGLEENVGLSEIADSIKEIGAFSQDRADTIAYTEVMRANSDSSMESYRAAQDAGVDLLKEWLTAAEPCPICEENEDEGAIEMDDDFSSGDDAPPAHPNCECAVAPVIDESADKMLKAGTFICIAIEKIDFGKAAKMPKLQADYVPDAKGSKHCGGCSMFRSPDSCTAVAGVIAANGLCKLFKPKRGR